MDRLKLILTLFALLSLALTADSETIRKTFLTTKPGRATMISPQEAPPAPDSKYAPPYYLDCGREAPYKSRSARTRVLSSPDGTTDAYGETKARAEGGGCSNTSVVYVRQNGGVFQLVFFQAPTELTLGNGVRLIDWSKDGTKLLFDVLRWQYGADAAPGNNLWIYGPGVLKRVPLNRILRRCEEACSVSFEPLGFSATGDVAMRFSAKQDYDEEGEAALPKCQERRIAWLFDPVNNRLTQISYEYSVSKWGRLR